MDFRQRQVTAAFRIFLCVVFLSLIGFYYRLLVAPVNGATLLYVSDTISNSLPGNGADHSIVFETISDLPPGGSIQIVPEDGSLDIPAGLDYTDIDLATSSALIGPYADRSIASSTPLPSQDSVAIVPGTSGSITITLAAQQGIPKDTFVRILIGDNAVFGAAGTVQMANPTSIASYRIKIYGKDVSGAEINEGTAMYAILPGVQMSADTIRGLPPTISNGLPTGTLPWGTTAAQLSVNVDEIAACRFATTSGLSYASMTNDLDFSLGNLLESTFIYGLANGSSYNFYVRCIDRSFNVNDSDYNIAFSVSAGAPPPPPGPGGGGGWSWPYPVPPPAPIVQLFGFGPPGSAVTIIQDGVAVRTLTADTQGSFNTSVTLAVNGVYTFALYAVDSSGTKSSYYASSLFVNVGTVNKIPNIFIPPTLLVTGQSVKPGAPIPVGGQTVPGAKVTVTLQGQAKGGVITATTTASGSGIWAIAVPTASLAVDTYSVKAQATLGSLGISNFSQIVYVGLGQNPTIKRKSADLNGDGKVNLADFSIFLYDLQNQNPIADFNNNGKVGLDDFSIMLSQWTG